MPLFYPKALNFSKNIEETIELNDIKQDLLQHLHNCLCHEQSGDKIPHLRSCRIDTCCSYSTVVWLAKTQGYTRGRLQRALRQGDMADPKGFLESMRYELANLPSAMSTVTFLVELTLAQMIELNRLIKLQGRNGYHVNNRDNPYCGYVIIDKDTMTGLYDPWQGGGSVLEIQLEKDVKLPVKYIRSALPDGGDGYAVETVYGMCGSAWKRGGVKIIHAPVKLAA